MELSEYEIRKRRPETPDLRNVLNGCQPDLVERPEVLYKRLLSHRPETGNLVQLRLDHLLPSELAMERDGEPVRLVADALEQLERGRRYRNRYLPAVVVVKSVR